MKIGVARRLLVLILGMVLLFGLEAEASTSSLEKGKYYFNDQKDFFIADDNSGYEPKGFLITKNDIHNGVVIGNFYVEGFTSKIFDKDGTIIFLKNAKDEISLHFDLKVENINDIKKDKTLSVSYDKETFDTIFNKEAPEFGKGALFVGYRDKNNDLQFRAAYINFLEAVQQGDAAKSVIAFQEGDYEVKLNYELAKKDIVLGFQNPFPKLETTATILSLRYAMATP